MRDDNKPLLVSKPMSKSRRAVQDSPVLLIPELCFMTRLSDEQRANFGLMKTMREYTRYGRNTIP